MFVCAQPGPNRLAGRFLIPKTMTQKKITINGKEYPIVFTIDTLMNFEAIAKESFFEANLNTLKNRMALIIAAVITANENTDLTVEMLKGKGDIEAVKQIAALNLIVTEAMGEFFEVPDVVKSEEAAEHTDESDEKATN